MTAKPLSSTVCTRLKIVRGLSHAIYGKSHNSPHPDAFGVAGDSPTSRLGCLIGGRRGHFQDTSSLTSGGMPAGGNRPSSDQRQAPVAGHPFLDGAP